jgi:hypothetical protein
MVRPKKYNKKPTGLELIQDSKNKDLVKWWFLEYLNGTEVMQKINPEKYKRYINSYGEIERYSNAVGGKKKRKVAKSSGNMNKITEAFKIWNESGYLESKEFPRENRKKHESKNVSRYRLNLNFFFDYLDPERKKLTPKQKEFMEKKFSIWRSKEKLFLERKKKLLNEDKDLIKYLEILWQQEIYRYLTHPYQLCPHEISEYLNWLLLAKALYNEFMLKIVKENLLHQFYDIPTMKFKNLKEAKSEDDKKNLKEIEEFLDIYDMIE